MLHTENKLAKAITVEKREALPPLPLHFEKPRRPTRGRAVQTHWGAEETESLRERDSERGTDRERERERARGGGKESMQWGSFLLQGFLSEDLTLFCFMDWLAGMNNSQNCCAPTTFYNKMQTTFSTWNAEPWQSFTLHKPQFKRFFIVSELSQINVFFLTHASTHTYLQTNAHIMKLKKRTLRNLLHWTLCLHNNSREGCPLLSKITAMWAVLRTAGSAGRTEGAWGPAGSVKGGGSRSGEGIGER